MPQITLADSAVAYNLYDKLAAIAAERGHPASCARLLIQLPSTDYGADYAANVAGTVLEVGKASAALDDIPSPDYALLAGESFNYPGGDINVVSLKTIWLKASVNNAVVNVLPIVR